MLDFWRCSSALWAVGSNALPGSLLEVKTRRGKFNAISMVAFLTHEECIVVLIKQPRLQVAANTRHELS